MPSSSGAMLGLGDPVMDIVAHVDHAFLASVTSEPGGCCQVSPEEMEAMQEQASTQSTLKRIPGGSAANVMKGLANISRQTLDCKFLGMIGKDDTGREYRTKLAAQGVSPLLLETSSGAPSARAICLVTPDGQRTMRTCLGASLELQQLEQLPADWDADLRILHCEGYCLYRPKFSKAVMQAAKSKGALVSIDLASFELVRHCKDAFLDLLESGCVDILLANEEEAATLAVELALTSADADHDSKVQASQDFLLKYIQVAVTSMGPKGCIAANRAGARGSSDAAKVVVVDTIGAGDCFTAGFLYAYLHGATLPVCCAVGCAAGAEAVQAEGAELSHQGWTRLQAAAARLLGEAAGKAVHGNQHIHAQASLGNDLNQPALQFA